VNILAICGSLRARSLNAAVLRAAREVAPGHWSVAMEAGLSGLPYFGAELEQEALPQVVAEFRGRVGAADGLLIATPEYAHGMSGVLKNALEWLVGGAEMAGKPVLVLSASPAATGGRRAQAWTRETLRVMGAFVLEDGLEVPAAAVKIVDGLLIDEPTRAELRKVLASLDEAIRDANAQA
jgi:chromate reductase, NAD(P)H dehydrogenase (quinone)